LKSQIDDKNIVAVRQEPTAGNHDAARAAHHALGPMKMAMRRVVMGQALDGFFGRRLVVLRGIVLDGPRRGRHGGGRHGWAAKKEASLWWDIQQGEE